jgi:hypothetical protein
MRKTLIGAVLLTVAMMGTAAAAPNFNGSTGMIMTPDTETLDQGSYSIGFHSADQGYGDVNSLSLNFGLAPNLELGLTRYDWDSGDSNTLNAKWKFAPEGSGSPALAFGIQDVTDEHDQTPYLVAGNTLRDGARVHYGIGGGTIDGLFGGFEKDFTSGTFLAEYDGNNLNVGARFAVAQDVKINVGLLDMDDFYFGISLTK